MWMDASGCPCLWICGDVDGREQLRVPVDLR